MFYFVPGRKELIAELMWRLFRDGRYFMLTDVETKEARTNILLLQFLSLTRIGHAVFTSVKYPTERRIQVSNHKSKLQTVYPRTIDISF